MEIIINKNTFQLSSVKIMKTGQTFMTPTNQYRFRAIISGSIKIQPSSLNEILKYLMLDLHIKLKVYDGIQSGYRLTECTYDINNVNSNGLVKVDLTAAEF